MSLPNILTLLRIALIPLIVLLLLDGGQSMRIAAIVFFAIAAITDYLDGYLARKSGTISALGRMLDPIADKLLVAVLIVILAFDASFGVWDLVPALAIMMREVFVSGLREFLGISGVVIHVSKLAKYKTTLQLVALGVVMAEPIVPGLTIISDILLWVAGGLTLITGIEYLRGAWPHLNEEQS